MSEYIQGDERDSAADTLRDFLNQYYPNTGDNPKPMIISPGGVLVANAYATPNDVQAKLTQDKIHVRLRDGDTEVLEESNQFTYVSENIYIDIIAQAADSLQPRLEQIRKTIDKIIFEKSNSQNPKFLDFAIAWIRVGKNENINNQVSGEIRLSAQRCKTIERTNISDLPAVRNIRIRPFHNFPRLIWDRPVTDKIIDEYEIQKRIKGTLTWVNFDDLPHPTTYLLLYTLEPNVTYEFRVAAEYVEGFSAWSETIEYTLS